MSEFPGRVLQKIKQAEEQKLTKLDLSEYYPREPESLEEIIESITKLSNLSVLILNRYKLKNLPESIAKLSNLTQLQAISSYLTSLPESIKMRKSLYYIKR